MNATEKRLAALEQRQGTGRMVIIDLTPDELTPDEIEARRADARTKAGPKGLVIEYVSVEFEEVQR